MCYNCSTDKLNTKEVILCNIGSTLNVYAHMFQKAQARVAQAMDGAFSFLRRIAQVKTKLSAAKSRIADKTYFQYKRKTLKQRIYAVSEHMAW